MKRRTWISLLSLIGLIFAACIMLIPVFRPGMMVTDDGNWMVIRLSAFYQSFREGQFPVRFLGRLNQSYGYPVANFLYPGFLYIGSVLHAIGLSFQSSVEMIIIGSVIVGALFTYLWLRRSFQSGASIIAALSYIFMPYFQFDIFKRGSIGEILALGIMPVALYATDAGLPWLLALVVLAIAVAHNTLAVFFIPLLFLYVAVKKNWRLIPSMILGVGMSSFFWLPMWFERGLVAFDTTVISNPGSYFGISNTIVLASTPLIVAMIIALFGWKKYRQPETILFLSILAVSIFFATKPSSFFWRIADFVKFIQFPFRFLSFAVVLGPWVIARALDQMRIGKVVASLCMVLVFTIFWKTNYFAAESIVRPEGYFSTNESTTTVHDEYLPRWASKQPSRRAEPKIEFFLGHGEIKELTVTTQTIDVLIHTDEKSVIQINTIYYPGWGAMLDDRPVPIIYDNPYGLIHISIPEGNHHLFVEFRETPGRFLADVVSIVSAILYGISCFIALVSIDHKKKKKSKRNRL